MQPRRAANNPWDISGAGTTAAVLRIGSRRVALADIRGYELSARQERDIQGGMLNYSAYLTVAAIFMVLVVQAGWRERFLLATGFFAIVGFTSIADIVRANRIRLYRMKLMLGDGGTAEFVSADPVQVDSLVFALRRAGKG